MQLIDSIPYNSLPYHSKLVKDYLAGKESLKSFYNHPPSLQGLLNAAEERVFSLETRVVLSDALTLQYGNLLHDGPVKENIEKLKSSNAFTITTGHQLCAYTGPAYFIYKIASTINLAKQLSLQDSTKNFIPVFWMASEDHDFEEISEVHLYGRAWKWEKKDESYGKVPVGLMKPNSIASWAAEMKQYFREDIIISDILDVFEEAYKTGETLSSATRKIVHELFKDFGLIIIDGNDKKLKEIFQPVLVKEIKEIPSGIGVRNVNLELHKLGYEGPITPREVNLFYIGSNNFRERMDLHENGFILHGSDKIFSTDEVLDEIQTSPEKFSPNVVLRPVYQEAILPNIAYIGGPGETAYWLQLKQVFDSFNIQFPVLIVRSSFAVLPDAMVSKASGYGFGWADYFNLNLDDLVKEFIKRSNSDELNFENEQKFISEIAASLNAKANLVDRQLLPQVAIEIKFMNDSLLKMQARFNKALKQKSDTDIKYLQRIKSTLFPQNMPQERIISCFDTFGLDKNDLEEMVSLSDPLMDVLKVVSRKS